MFQECSNRRQPIWGKVTFERAKGISPSLWTLLSWKVQEEDAAEKDVKTHPGYAGKFDRQEGVHQKSNRAKSQRNLFHLLAAVYVGLLAK